MRFWLSNCPSDCHTGGVFTILNNAVLATRMAGHTLCYFGSGRWRRAAGPMPRKACHVPADFFGLCVANAPESSSDSYVIARLNELGIRHVRLDFTYADRDAFTERFLDRLLNERFQVCLHLVQPREEVRVMPGSEEAAERWRSFIGEMLDRYGSRLALIEIGATCNRRKWSGYSPAAFFAAWQIAWEEARGRNLAIAGPNVTDFEPFYNAGWLGEMRRNGMLPGVHTDNLFVERATEPEAFDRKIGGTCLAGALRFNLVRKAQLLQDIGAWAGTPILMCAHVSWSLRRIARFLEDVEEKQADYLARYICLAAASGALARVYWGPLIGQREGLIDDGTSEYPEIPHVTYYEQARGDIKNYRLRPAYRTFQAVNRLLTGSTFKRRLPAGAGLEMLEFVAKTDDRRQPAHRSPLGEGGTSDTGPEKAESRAEKQTPNPSADGPNAQSETKNATSPLSGASGHLAPCADVEERGTRNGAILHAVWTTDGNGASLDAFYPPELLDQAEIYSRDGERLEHAPRMFSESPVFILWPSNVLPPACDAFSPASLLRSGSFHRRQGFPLREAASPFAQRASADTSAGQDGGQAGGQAGVCRLISGFRFARQPGWDFDVIRPEAGAGRWTGVYLAEAGGKRFNIQALLELCQAKTDDGGRTPDAGLPCEAPGAKQGHRTTDDRDQRSEIIDKQSAIRNPQSKILRAARNTVWSTSAPWNADQTIVIKEFKPRPIIRRILDWNKPNRAVRSWNGAQELLRRGLHTPAPIACLLPAKTARRAPSFYICDAFAPAWSVRDAFTAFSAGATAFQGQSTSDLYEAIAAFLQKMHTRGVYFRDLSAGNLLFRQTSSGEPEFALIDTARARFHRHSLGLRLRLCDLIRICHPLNWPGRRVFVDKYMAHNGRRFSWWMKFPFRYYDWKHRVKNALKKHRL